MPRPIATAAAIAVTAARTGETRRRESSGTTVCFSARALARIRSRSVGARGAGRRRPRPARSVTSQNEAQLLLALLAAAEVLLERVPLGGIERVERVAGGQLVNSGFHDPSSAPSSRSSRRRASPANILLLIVPSGIPSLSASSDCE